MYAVTKYLWEPFHLVFIAIMQLTLIWGITLPVYASTVSSESAKYPNLVIFSLVLFVFALLLETKADQE